MQRSFSVVEDDDESPTDFNEEQILKKYESLGQTSEKKSLQEMDDDEDDFENKAPKIPRQLPRADLGETANSPYVGKIPSAGPGPSGRQTVLKSAPINKRLSSESDLEASDDEEKIKNSVPGEYDPKLYENLDVGPETKEIFQYITKYIPQPMTLDYKFKPFVPEFLPAVGDIDAFLKVIPPTTLFQGQPFEDTLNLGLTVLDEPAANQSDAALLHLQLRAESVNASHSNDNVVVKKVDNVEKNVKTIDKWIKDISALHKSKSSPSVKYTEQMPDLDELLQEWPEGVEKHLKDNFPEPGDDLLSYVSDICGVFQIPAKNKVQALHLLFSLYAAVKSSQLFKSSQLAKGDDADASGGADQLVLE